MAFLYKIYIEISHPEIPIGPDSALPSCTYPHVMLDIASLLPEIRRNCESTARFHAHISGSRSNISGSLSPLNPEKIPSSPRNCFFSPKSRDRQWKQEKLRVSDSVKNRWSLFSARNPEIGNRKIGISSALFRGVDSDCLLFSGSRRGPLELLSQFGIISPAPFYRCFTTLLTINFN